MLSKKTIAASAAIGAMALTVAACSGGNQGSENGGNEVTVWTLTQDGSQKEAWDAFVAAFEEANPDITIVTEERATDPHKDALRQAAGTDAGPDLYRYWGGAGLGGELVDVGMSADLTQYYEEYGWADVLTPAALQNATQYGGYHGVPFIQATEAVFYNKALFEQAGITEVPTTYEDLVAAAQQLKDAGITPMEFGGTVNWHVMRLLDSLIETMCGAEKADELTQGDGDWGAEPCVTEAFTELKMWGDEYLNEGFMAISNDDASQLFFSGQAAMTIEGNWFGPMAIDAGMSAEDLGIFSFPTGTGRAYGFGELLYMTPNASNPDAAAKFLDYMVSVEGQEKLGTAFSTLSVNADVEPPADAPLTQEWQAIVSEAEGAYINNDQNFSTAETTEFWRVQNSVLTGDLDPADAGAEFQKWRDANE
ncbi:ABC transporter substrate-binding protein [Isoptericola variabilis]|uniref:Extracellular solute-binding protein family 1 n=1 Tax=Isoptericola variabilis (strain 225) TaxID=743718 RepID=F6FW04_ISOV2|nr:extracellular solute-binding protein [Isoptericola variabilis]AEG44474.1 extracellular solute-binding protein family 1 [Isoptericola variabilis 225]TWH26613.1 raffinose/stachyose/melibiose transport system substrate-binding protein [Isoptericola variabilis J7]